MPTFDVDIGKQTYEVDAPDERTAWAWANQTHQNDEQEKKKAVDTEVASMRQGSALKRGARGAWASLQNLGYGLNGIVSDLTPEQQQTVNVNKRFLDEDTAGFVGGLATDVASFALPGGAALKVARALPAAMKLAKAAPLLAPLAGNVALDTGLAAAYAPEDRGEAALSGAAGSVIGQGLARGAGRVLGGVITPSADAAELMKSGVNVPIWKSVDNGIVRGSAERAKALPFAGSLIKGQERKALEGFNRKLSIDASPPTPVLDEAGGVLRWESKDPVTEIGASGINQLKERFDNAYDALYKGRGIPIDEAYGSEAASISGAVAKYSSRIKPEFEDALREVDDLLRAGTESTPIVIKNPYQRLSSPGKPSPEFDKWVMFDKGIDPVTKLPVQTSQLGHATSTPESLKAAISSINDRIDSAWRRGDAELAGPLGELRDALQDLRIRALPPEVASQAKGISKAYANFKQLQGANNTVSAQKAGIVTPQQVLQSIRKNDKTLDKTKFSQGKALNQGYATTANRVLGNILPDVGPGTAEKMMLPGMMMAPSLIGMDLGIGAGLAAATSATGQKFLMGGYGKQKAIQDALRRYSPYAGDLGASFISE